MPIGVLTDNLMVALGGLIGGLLGKKLPRRISDSLIQISGFAALGIAITLVTKVHSLGAVVLSVILGTIIGSALNFDDGVTRYFSKLNSKLVKGSPDEEYMAQFTTLLVLCCTSGTGVFGSMTEGLTGDNTIIICKAILDFFTVMIFASQLGKFCAVISIPQMIILLAFFFSAKLLTPIMTDVIKADFTAAGGIIELIIGLRILKLSKAKTIDTLPALILVFPISYLWNLIF